MTINIVLLVFFFVIMTISYLIISVDDEKPEVKSKLIPKIVNCALCFEWCAIMCQKCRTPAHPECMNEMTNRNGPALLEILKKLLEQND